MPPSNRRKACADKDSKGEKGEGNAEPLVSHVELIPEPKKHQPPPILRVVTHPLVLLSAVDHADRVLRDSRNENSRVVGVLLGSLKNGVLDISNCFAVPFEEDPRDKQVWFLDHDYLETLFAMFRKVNARERIVGWYHTGRSLCHNDVDINEVFRRYCPHSVLVRVRTASRNSLNSTGPSGLPVEAFYAVEEVHDDGSPATKAFEHLPVEIDAEEAEEVGVEHLLRDIKDSTASSLTQKELEHMEALSGISEQLDTVLQYLTDVEAGVLDINQQILCFLQDLLNLLPEASVTGNSVLATALNAKVNDHSTALYVNVIVRSVIALHDLIANKITNRERERTELEERRNKTGGSAGATSSATPAGDQNKSNSGERKEDTSCGMQ